MSAFTNETNRVHNLLISCMNESVLLVEADTKTLCPVRTGNLKRSYTHEVEDKKELQTQEHPRYASFIYKMNRNYLRFNAGG